VIALHVVSGKETRYNSMIDAASALGLDRKTLTLRLQQGSTKELQGYVFRICSEHLAAQKDRPGEIWADALIDGQRIKGVRVSSMGRVQLINGRRTEGAIQNDRHKVWLQVNKKTKHFNVYVLIAHTFIGPPPSPVHTVDHKDGDSLNDHLSNLQWATKKEQGRNQKRNRVVCKYDLEGSLLDTYGTIAEAAEANEIPRSRLKEAAKTGKSTHGFRWEFVQKKTSSRKAGQRDLGL
jgi:hypothetical protein